MPALALCPPVVARTLQSPGRTHTAIEIYADPLAAGLLLLGKRNVQAAVAVEVRDLQGTLVNITRWSEDMLDPCSVARVGRRLIPYEVPVVVHGAHGNVQSAVPIEIAGGSSHIAREARIRID